VRGRRAASLRADYDRPKALPIKRRDNRERDHVGKGLLRFV